MAVISISYDEGSKKPDLGYKSVKIFYGNNQEKVFKSGNFITDWYVMRKFMINELMQTEPHFSHSSSVDHFIMDGAKFDSAYLIVTDDVPELKYLPKGIKYKNKNAPTDEERKKFLEHLAATKEITEKGIEFFVPENTKPTWAELRKLCGDRPLKKVVKPKAIKPLSDEQIEKLQKSMAPRLLGGWNTSLPVSDEKLLARFIASYKQLRNKQMSK